MASKKTSKKVESRLAVTKQTAPATIEQYEKGLLRIWEAFSNKLSTITEEQLPEAVTFIKATAGLAEEAGKYVKPMVVKLLKEKGKVATDAGTRRMTVSGYVLEIQPDRQGYVAQKVEALIRAKGLDPAKYMDTKVTYLINEGKMADAVKDGKMTQDEWNTCKNEESWKLMSPKKEK